MPRRGLLVGTTALVLLFLLHARYYDGILYDDPFISYRYARHLAAGEGLVFNRGERLEGFSNFLHVVAMAGAARVGIEPPAAGPLLTHVAAIAVLAWLGFVAARGALDPTVAVVTQVLLVASPAFAFWPPRGLETSCHAALVFFGAWCAMRALAGGGDRAAARWVGAWACLAAAGMMRIEGPMFGLALGAWGGAAWWRVRRGAGAGSGSGGRTTDPMPGWRGFVAGAAGFVVVLAAYHAWRVWYFGELLPNTYHAKATGPLLERWRLGTAYLARTLTTDLLAPTLVLAGGWAAWGWARWLRGAGAAPGSAQSGAGDDALMLPPAGRRLIGGAVALQAFFAWWVGGDWMGYARFLMPVVPLVALLAAEAIARGGRNAVAACAGGGGRRDARDVVLTAAALAAALGLVVGTLRSEPMMRALRSGSLTDPIAALGQWLHDDARRRHPGADPMDISVAAEEMGLLPWHSGLRFLDMLGLVTREIGRREGGLHEKFDAAWILGQRPDYIVILAAPQEEGFDAATLRGAFPSSQQMIDQPDFAPVYELRRRQSRGTPLFGRVDMLVFARRTEPPPGTGAGAGD